MIRTTSWTVAGLCLFSAALGSARADMVVGVFDSTRTTTANIVTGIFTHDAVASLLSHFPGTTFSSSPTLTPPFLAGVNVLIIGSPMTDSVGITPLSAGEQSALLNYVLSGGSAFLIAEGYSPFLAAAQSMISPFGMTTVNDSLTGVLSATPNAPAHPVINGPFGNTGTIYVYGSGMFTNLGPYATSLARMDLTQQSVLAVIESHAMGPTSGRVVFMADSTVLVNGALGGFFPQYEPLFLNTIDYLAVPEPSGLVMAGILGSALMVAAGKCCRKRRSKA